MLPVTAPESNMGLSANDNANSRYCLIREGANLKPEAKVNSTGPAEGTNPPASLTTLLSVVDEYVAA